MEKVTFRKLSKLIRRLSFVHLKVSCQFPATGGFWSVEEWKFHINVLELKVDKLAIMSFTLKERDAVSVHIRMDNMTVLSYLTKMGLPKTRSWLRSAKKFDNIF